MDNDNRRPRPGFISDAEDMLHDFDEIDRMDEGVLTQYKIDSINMFLDFDGDDVNPEFFTRNFTVSLEDVERVISEHRAK
jgi:hypothetical protein